MTFRLATFVFCALWPVVSQASQQEGLKPFGWLATLTGSCWVGSLPDGKVTDTQCYETELDRFLRGTITIGDSVPQIGKPSGFRGAAIFAWNSKENRIDYWQWASDGSYRAAEARFEGDMVIFPMPRRTAESPQERTVWSRIDQSSFRVVRERQDGQAWTPTVTVVYRRR